MKRTKVEESLDDQVSLSLLLQSIGIPEFTAFSIVVEAFRRGKPSRASVRTILSGHLEVHQSYLRNLEGLVKDAKKTVKQARTELSLWDSLG